MIRARLENLQQQLAELRSKRQQQEMELLNIENLALRQRFQEILDSLLNEQLQKEQEVCGFHLHFGVRTVNCWKPEVVRTIIEMVTRITLKQI